MHNQHRKFVGGLNSYSVVEEKIARLREEGIPFGTVGVLTEKNYVPANRIYKHMCQMGVSCFDFTPAIYDEEDACAPTNKTYFRFFKELFDVYQKNFQEGVQIKIIQDIAAVIAYEKGVLQETPQVSCEFAGECGNALSVLPNGDIFPCECLVNIPRFKLGNIQKSSLKKIVEGKEFRYFVSEYNKLSNQCYHCRWFPVCKGGCFHRRLPECNGDKGTDYFCAGRKALFCHIEKALTKRGKNGEI